MPHTNPLELLQQLIETANRTIIDLRAENEKLKAQLASMSCCCSDCTRHNIGVLNAENNGLNIDGE